MSNRLSHTRIIHSTDWSRRGILLTALGIPAFSQQKNEQEIPEDSIIRVDVERVSVLFSVRDKRGTFINNLTKDDIEVYEDGKLQETISFDRETDLPLTVGLLIDVSVSQGALIETERAAASQFFGQVLQKKDMAFIISFGSEAELLQDSTNSVKALERGLSDLRMNSASGGYITPGTIPQSNPRGTIMYDAVYLGATEKLQHEVGRKALILISDGMDQGSRIKQNDAIRSALKADSLIYGVYYMDPRFYGYGGGGGYGAMKKMSEETGGRAFEVGRKQSLQSIFQEIQDEMRSQYSLSYSSSNPARDGGYRKLEIRSKNKALKIQARKGYFAPSR